MKEQETRGIKDPERFKRQQLKKEEHERRQEEAEKGGRGGGLKVDIVKNKFWSFEVQLT
jgi:hypothetical protein